MLKTSMKLYRRLRPKGEEGVPPGGRKGRPGGITISIGGGIFGMGVITGSVIVVIFGSVVVVVIGIVVVICLVSIRGIRLVSWDVRVLLIESYPERKAMWFL